MLVASDNDLLKSGTPTSGDFKVLESDRIQYDKKKGERASPGEVRRNGPVTELRYEFENGKSQSKRSSFYMNRKNLTLLVKALLVRLDESALLELIESCTQELRARRNPTKSR